VERKAQGPEGFHNQGKITEESHQDLEESSINWKGRIPCAIFNLHLLGDAKVERDDLSFTQCSCHPRRYFYFLPNILITD